MKVVLAKPKDLNEIKNMYSKIVEHMNANDIHIWNEYYPNEVFSEDIKNKTLYLLKDDSCILGAFVMYEHKDIEKDVKWKDKKAKAFLINRVGVNVNCLRQGIGQEIINQASLIAKEKGASFLRLLVCQENTPAICLYEKCQFKKVDGIHEEVINDDYSIFEFAYEKLII